jgi:DNA-directed RNA polymerase subunit M/transcription elongation factor TFIIS
MINNENRNKIFDELKKKFPIEIAKDIEESIYIYSKNKAEDDEVLFLMEGIYESKSKEILCILNNKNLMYIIKAIKQNKINPKKIARMKPEELNYEKYSSILKKKELEEMRKEDKVTTNAFECEKCKKSKCSVIEKQIRSGDEPATAFITCHECGHVFTF